MKKIVLKYTVKVKNADKPETHYVQAYTEEYARNGLAEFLNVSAKSLWLSKKNLPFKIRKAIEDPKNKEYVLTLDIKTLPLVEKSIEERQVKFFDLRNGLLKSVMYKIKALGRQDKEILLEYSDFGDKYTNAFPGYEKEDLVDSFTYGENAYTNAIADLHSIIQKEKFQDEKFEDGHYILDILQALSYSINFTKA